MKFELSIQEAAYIVRLLGQQPTESGVFPLHQNLTQQFKEQEAAAQQAPEAVAAGLSD